MQKPSIGRIVHYHEAFETEDDGIIASAPIAAIVTEIRPDGDPCLTLFRTGEKSNHRYGVPHSEQPAPGHWSWPPHT